MSDTATLDGRHVWHPFTQAKTAASPIPIRSARGAVLTAEDGREFVDLISSWWVTLHGHAHPKIATAIAEQARKLEQVIFAGFTHEPAARLAARLAGILPEDLDRVFFSDDGSTAVEVALKIAHQVHRNRGQEGRTRTIAFEGGYHGDTVGAMSAGAESGFFDHWKHLLFPVTPLPYPETWEGDDLVESKEEKSLQALDRALAEHGDETAALIMEPLVQGASGMRMARPEFIRAVAERVKEAGALLIFDEVMTGFGRTGDLFACTRAGVTPDLICLSKGLTGGFLPLSVTVCRESIYRSFSDDSFDKAFAHGHSFTANPLGCAAANASLDLLLSDECEEARQRIEASHRTHLPRHPKLIHPRICGTIAAMDFDTGECGYTAAIGQELKAFFLDQGLLIRPLGNVVYLIPPYCIDDGQLDRAYRAILEAAERLT